MKPLMAIEYCLKCGWLLRAAYMAEEILTTFSEDVKAVSLQLSKVSGRFIVFLKNYILFDHKKMGRFPEIKELKQLIRDHVNPNKSMGHSD